MNTNLKIALLLGYEFTRHGWICPGSTDDYAVKVWDDQDYNMLAFNSVQSLISAMNSLEEKYQLQFEFTRMDGIYRLLKVHRINPLPEDTQLVVDSDFASFLRKVLEKTFIKDVSLEMEQIKVDLPWHYEGLLIPSRLNP